jgi:hypothetical protein
MRILGLVLHATGVTFVAFLLVAFYVARQSSGTDTFMYQDYPIWTVGLAIVLVVLAIASVWSRLAVASSVVLLALALVYSLSITAKPPEILGMSLGANVAASSMLALVGCVVQVYASRRVRRTGEMP